MTLIRKILKGALAFGVAFACLAGTAMFVKLQADRAVRRALREAGFDFSYDLSGILSGDDGTGRALIRDFDEVARMGDNDNTEPPRFFADSAQARGPASSSDAIETEFQAKAVIDDELPDASPEEREIWGNELKQHRPDTIREILALRRFALPRETAELPTGVQLAAAERQPPRRLAEVELTSAAQVPADALGVVDSAIEAIRSGEQVILNNIANANTLGFKRCRALFGDLSYRQSAIPGQVDQSGHSTTTGIALGTGVKLVATQADVSQGRLRHTGQLLDLAIDGEGFFQINDANRFLYCRAGVFSIDADGQVVLASKDRARPLEPSICIPHPTTKIMISPEGIVSVLQPGQTQLKQVGLIQIARFINPQGLMAKGENLFEPTTAAGTPQVDHPGSEGLGLGELKQGYLEESNVVAITELAELHRLQEQLKTLQHVRGELTGMTRAP